MCLLGSAFPLSFRKTQALLDELLGVEISRGTIARVRQRLSAARNQPMQEALAFARQLPVAYMDETGAPTGNADGNNATGKSGWRWVMVTAAVTVFIQGLSRSAAAAIELLGSTLRDCGERSLIGLQPSPPGAAAAVLSSPDPRSNSHRRTPGRQR